jgi:kelch-like protein 24/35
METARHSFDACVMAGEVYVFGGRDDDDALSSVEKYSPSSDTWSAVVPLPEARTFHAAVTVGSTMDVLGGMCDVPNIIAASVLKFDSARGAWSEVAPMPEARAVPSLPVRLIMTSTSLVESITSM